MSRRLAGLSILLFPIGLLTGCEFFPNATVTIAPWLGRDFECEPYQLLAADAKAWLDRHPEKPPASWGEWKAQPRFTQECPE